MTGIGVAERVREVVVGREPAEQLGGADPAADPAADAGGVVEDDPGGNAADVLEYLLERLAHALGVLSWEHLGESDVGVGEGEHEEAQPGADAGHVEVRLAEICLGLARLPNQIEELAAVGRALLPELRDVAADRGLADVRAALADQPLPDAPCGMALLAPVLGVLLQPMADDRLVGVELAGVAPLGGRSWGETVLVDVLVDGVSGDAVHPRDIRDAEPVAPLLAYRINGGHVDHCLSRLSE